MQDPASPRRLTVRIASEDLDRLGAEIAEPLAHLEAATARLLALIREFDARDGWGNGFRLDLVYAIHVPHPLARRRGPTARPFPFRPATWPGDAVPFGAGRTVGGRRRGTKPGARSPSARPLTGQWSFSP